MGLYVRYIKILFKSQMQYRVSFLLLSFGQFFVPFASYITLYLLFERFNSIKGWSFYEVALCFGVIHMAFSISECCLRGFDAFSGQVASGSFDRILVRPRSTFLQVLGSKFEFTRIGRLAQGITVFYIAVTNVDVYWSIPKIITLVMMIVSGVFIFAGIFIITATISFWTIQGIELANILTDGGREISQYPLNIYRKWVTRFFTFVIPFGCVNYLPLMSLLDKTGENSFLMMLTPLVGILFIFPSMLVWKFGIRHYRSTGS